MNSHYILKQLRQQSKNNIHKAPQIKKKSKNVTK